MNLISFLSGIYMITFATSGLIFFKFYKSTGDRFFKFFGFACGLFSIERLALFFVTDPLLSTPSTNSKPESWVYIIRLVAFLIIVYAILEKNRKPQD